MAQLVDKSETTGFGFDECNGNLNHARHLVEESADWLSANDRHFIERYEHGDLEVVVKLRTGFGAKEYDLILTAVPSSVGGESHISGVPNESALVHNGTITGHRQNFVLVPNTYFVECPQKVIPSSVRLERSQDRVDLLRNIPAPSLEILFKGSRVPGKWEVCLPRTAVSAGDSNAVNGVVESCAEVHSRVTNDLREALWNRLGQPNFPIHVARIFRVWLNDSFAGIFLKEGVDIALEDFDVMVTPRQLAP